MKAIDAVIGISKALDGWDGTHEQAAEKLGAAVAIVKAYASNNAPEMPTADKDTKGGVVSRYKIEEFHPVDGYFNLISRDGKLLAKSYSLDDARTIIGALEKVEAIAATAPAAPEVNT